MPGKIDSTKDLTLFATPESRLPRAALLALLVQPSRDPNCAAHN
jgi:hypothetical protein